MIYAFENWYALLKKSKDKLFGNILLNPTAPTTADAQILNLTCRHGKRNTVEK